MLTSGHSICHHGNNIYQHRLQLIMWLYHPQHTIMAITSATLLNNITHHLQCGFTTCHTNKTITSATSHGNKICHSKLGNNICQGNILLLTNTWLNICHKIIQIYHMSNKITGHTNTHTPSSVGKNI